MGNGVKAMDESVQETGISIVQLLGNYYLHTLQTSLQEQETEGPDDGSRTTKQTSKYIDACLHPGREPPAVGGANKAPRVDLNNPLQNIRR